MQWLIFGATGYTGNALLKECLELGHSVWAHVRPASGQRDRVRNSVRTPTPPPRCLTEPEAIAQ